MHGVVISLLVVLAVLVVLVILFFAVRKIETMLIFPVPRRVSLGMPGVSLKQNKATNMRYWMFNPGQLDNKKEFGKSLLIVFHGNGCLASDMTDVASQALKAKMACALVEYPGYDNDNQVPSQDKILKSSLACFDHIKCKHKHAKQIILFGQSLGTCVATYVASMRKVSKVVLVSCFPSIAKVARLGFLQVLLANKFQAETWAKKVKAHVLAVHAELDELIPYSLFVEQASNFLVCQQHTIKFQTHNSILASSDFWKVFHDFVQRPLFEIVVTKWKHLGDTHT